MVWMEWSVVGMWFKIFFLWLVLCWSAFYPPVILCLSADYLPPFYFFLHSTGSLLPSAGYLFPYPWSEYSKVTITTLTTLSICLYFLLLKVNFTSSLQIFTLIIFYLIGLLISHRNSFTIAGYLFLFHCSFLSIHY